MAALVTDLLSVLRAHRLIQAVRVVQHDETPYGKVELKVRCLVSGGYQFQVWLHHEPAFQDYAYQLFSDRPRLRWDNAPHYPDVATAPHHFHSEAGDVGDSPLCGDPLIDLPYVLAEIERWMTGH